MKKVIFTILSILTVIILNAQIPVYYQLGINMPGDWNGWTNIPTDQTIPYVASKPYTGFGWFDRDTVYNVMRWQTVLSTGFKNPNIASIDTTSQNFKFTLGPANSPWRDQWTTTTVIKPNQFVDLSYCNCCNPSNNVFDVPNNLNLYFVVNFWDNGYNNSRVIFQQLSDTPHVITGVTIGNALDNTPVDVTVTFNGNGAAEESVYIFYTVDGGANWSRVSASMSGVNQVTLQIPGQPAGTNVQFKVVTTALPTVDFDTIKTNVNLALAIIDCDNNNGNLYSYTVQASTKVDEQIQSKLNIYPNPTEGIVNIVADEPGYVRIISTDGKLLKEVYITGKAQIDVSNLNSGVYLIEFKGKTASKTAKLILK